MCLDKVEAAIEDIRDGKMVIVVDEEDRENEGDLTIAAEKVTPEVINFMATYGRGLICMPMTSERLDELKIPQMVNDNQSLHGTAFCVSIEARRNVSTGISAADRAETILTAIHSDTRPDDLIRPGHIFPLRAKTGGVLARAGQTEAAVDMARLAGQQPAGVICEIMNPDGTMARMKDLVQFSEEHKIRILSVVDLIKYRLRTERFIRRLEVLPFDCEFGSFDLYLYESQLDGSRHLAFVKGDVGNSDPVLLRVQVESVLSDVFGSNRFNSGREVQKCLQIIEREGRGVLVYLRLKDPGHGLLKDVQEHKGQVHRQTEYASFKDVGIGGQIVSDLALHNVRVLTNHPKKMAGLEGFDINVVEQLGIDTLTSEENPVLEEVASTASHEG
jgi:3,4-dihydroxy 2-butanone 4-phosphate synthase/GTP cyclohydrolase II